MRWAPCGFLPGQAEKSWAVSCSRPCSCGTRTLQSHQAAAGHQPRLLPLPLPWSPLRSAGGAGRFLGPNPGSEGRKSAAAKERKPAGFPCASARRVRGAGRSQIANEIGGGGSTSFLPCFLGRTREAWPGHCFLQLLLGWAGLSWLSPRRAVRDSSHDGELPSRGTAHGALLSPACGDTARRCPRLPAVGRGAWPAPGPGEDPRGGCRACGTPKGDAEPTGASQLSRHPHPRPWPAGVSWWPRGSAGVTLPAPVLQAAPSGQLFLAVGRGGCARAGRWEEGGRKALGLISEAISGSAS